MIDKEILKIQVFMPILQQNKPVYHRQAYRTTCADPPTGGEVSESMRHFDV